MSERTVVGFFERYVDEDRKSSRHRECICWKCLSCGEFFFTEPVGPPESCPLCFAGKQLDLSHSGGPRTVPE